MSSIYKKPATMSNWFSSLRRPLKSKKQQQQQQHHQKYQQSSSTDNITNNDEIDENYKNKKKLQKSCIDLTTSNSIFYTELPKTDELNHKIVTTDEKSSSNSSDVDDNDDDDDDDIGSSGSNKKLLSGRNVRQLCSKCCCHINKSPSDTPTETATTPIPIPLLLQSPLISSTTNTKPFLPINETYNSELKIETDSTTDFQITKIPKLDGNHKIVYNKCNQFKRTTTTTVTRTTILTNNYNHRDGMIFSDNGELLSKKFQKFRSNSLGSILNCDDNSGRPTFQLQQYQYNNNNNNNNNKSVDVDVLHQNSPLLNDNNDFLFIDETCSGSGDSETDTNNNNTKNNIKNSMKFNDNLLCDNNNVNSSNKNSTQNLCVACKNPLPVESQNFNQHSQQFQQLIDKTNFDNSINIKSLKQIKDELCEVVSEMETLDSQEDCKHSNKDKQMSIGRKKFNMDPKKGIEYLVDNRLLQTEPQDIAHFLYKGEGLNKTAIGDYLGEKNDFNEKVLKAFVELHDFTNLILVQALRQFLWSFRLPGEAQKIDRMMECFAQRYCQLNPDIFTNTDTCYVLSFAIIMLNTSLHNPSVKDKPSVEQFITMNRGINNGGDLPRGLLESLYESIRTEPFKIPQDDGNDLMHTFFNPDKEGWLWKQGGRYKSWKRRWFILNDNCLYYFEYTTDKEPRGIIPLENISVREIQDRNKPHCFELYACGGADIIKACKTDSEGKVVEGKHTVYRMSAATEEDKQEWIKRLTQSISHNPFYDILVQRKKKALAKS